jgi:hypothetical protein
MELMDLKTDFNLVESLHSLSPHSGAALSLRTFMRVLPLISLYSEGRNKANFPIEPLAFWPYDMRRSYLSAVFASVKKLKGVIEGDLNLDEAETYMVGESIEDAEISLTYTERGAISFSSSERKNAFCTIQKLIINILTFAYIAQDAINYDLASHIRALDYQRRDLKIAKVSLLSSLNQLSATLKLKSSEAVLENYRQKIRTAVIADAKNSARRLKYFSELITEFLQEFPAADCVTFAEKISHLESAYLRAIQALEKNENPLLEIAYKDLFRHWKAYENERVEKALSNVDISVDFYVAVADCFGQLIRSFDKKFEQNFKEKVDLVSRYSEQLLAVIKPNESTRDVTEDQLNDFVDICDEISALNTALDLDDVRHKSVDVKDLIGEVLQEECNSVENEPVISKEWKQQNIRWVSELFSLMTADVDAYTSYDLKAYSDLLYEELVADFDCRQEKSDAEVLNSPLWRSERFEQKARGWANLREIFCRDIEKFSDDRDLAKSIVFDGVRTI